MSTSLSQVYTDGSVAANRTVSGVVGVDRRRRRFGLNPGGYRWDMHPRESGQQGVLLPAGLITFRTAALKVENFDNVGKMVEWNQDNPKEIIREHEAAFFANNVKIKFEDQGFRELPSLTMLDDPSPNEKGNITKEQIAKSAPGYFLAVFPAFVEVGHECPQGLTECVTCRLALLDSDIVLERIARLIDPSIGMQVRDECRESVQSYYSFANGRWSELISEKGSTPGIKKLGEAEHHIRKHLHEIEPSEAATAASFGIEVGAAQAEGFKELAAAMREGKADNGLVEVLKGLMETQKQQGQILAELSKKKSE